MFLHKIGVIILIFKVIENSEAKFLTEEQDWSNSSSKIILSYQYKSLQSDYFAHAICDSDNKQDIKVCNVQIEFPRFSGIPQKCNTTLRSSEKDKKPILTSGLTVIGDKILFPWIIEEGDKDLLMVRLINMKNCDESNTLLEVVKRSLYKIIPFSDSYDIFYQPTWSNEVGYKRYYKISFDRNGNETKAMSVPFFSHILAEEIMYIGSEPRPLEQLLPVSSISSSKGYFFLPRRKLEVQILSPLGIRKQSQRTEFVIWPHECFYGLEGILINDYLNRTSRRLMQLDENLEKRLDHTYVAEEGKMIMEFASIGVDEVLMLTCDKHENEVEDVATSNCYLEKIYANDMVTPPLQIPPIHVSLSTQIYLSFVEEHICVNAVTYGEGGRIEKLQTVCTEKDLL